MGYSAVVNHGLGSGYLPTRNRPWSPVGQGGMLWARISDLRGFTPGRPFVEGLLDLTTRIHHDFRFDAKVTTIRTPIEEVFRKKRGVCQDFAQIQIACLRSINLPARYVSGYLRTYPPPGQPRMVGADASHAWASAYCPGIGWTDVDPTNDVVPSTGHVTIAWGRDFVMSVLCTA